MSTAEIPTKGQISQGLVFLCSPEKVAPAPHLMSLFATTPGITVMLGAPSTLIIQCPDSDIIVAPKDSPFPSNQIALDIHQKAIFPHLTASARAWTSHIIVANIKRPTSPAIASKVACDVFAVASTIAQAQPSWAIGWAGAGLFRPCDFVQGFDQPLSPSAVELLSRIGFERAERRDGGVVVCTSGFHALGFPDIMYGPTTLSAGDLYNAVMNLMSYCVRLGRPLTEGETFSIGQISGQVRSMISRSDRDYMHIVPAH